MLRFRQTCRYVMLSATYIMPEEANMKPKYLLNGCIISLILIVLSACLLSSIGLAAVMHGIVV